MSTPWVTAPKVVTLRRGAIHRRFFQQMPPHCGEQCGGYSCGLMGDEALAS